MRVLLINWAPISRGASLGGGVNGYCQRLALQLLALGGGAQAAQEGGQDGGQKAGGQSGVTVTYLSAGTSSAPRSVFPGPAVVRRPAWQGVEILELINSPIQAPGILNHHHPETEISSPELERVIEAIVRGSDAPTNPKPSASKAPAFDIVHFHNIEGLSAGSIHAAKRAGAKVVFSLHNYHTLCPQVYFLHRNSAVCHDFEGGLRCAGCVPDVGVDGSMMERSERWFQDLNESTPSEVVQTSAKVVGIKAAIDATNRPFHWSRLAPSPRAATSRVPDMAPIRILNNPESDSSGPSRNAFGRRREAMVSALNSCDLVHAVSSFVAEKFVAMGVRSLNDAGETRVCTIPIGTDAAAAGGVMTPRVFCPDGLIRLVFLGYNNYAKGLHVLLAALKQVSREAASRFHLSIAAKDLNSALPAIQELTSQLARVQIADGYRLQDVPEILSQQDVGIVPSVWWDNGPQTVLEFQALGLPVIASRLGGIPDQVHDGVDGMLFTGGDHAELARVLEGLSADAVRSMAASVRPPKSMRQHAREIQAMYRQMLVPRRAEPARASAV